MSRPVRIVLASVLLLIALVGLVGLLPQITQTFYLPVTAGSVSEHTSFFGPAVAAAVVVALLVALLVVHLVRVALRARRAAEWIIAVVVAAAALALPFLVAGFDRPVF
jgi:hypothetical protein